MIEVNIDKKKSVAFGFKRLHKNPATKDFFKVYVWLFSLSITIFEGVSRKFSIPK